MSSRLVRFRLLQRTGLTTSCQVAAFQVPAGVCFTSPPKPTRTLGRASSVPLAVCTACPLWPCDTACSWQSDAVSLARITSSIRGFRRSRLRTSRAFPPFGFVPSQALSSSCIVLHLQPKGQVFPLTARCFCSTLSGRYLSLQVYLHIFPCLATIIHLTLSTLSRVAAPLSLSLPCTSSKSTLHTTDCQSR